MTRQIPLSHIRRCRNCGYKTHQRFWENGQCPVCDSAYGYAFSAHGGLTAREIKKAKLQISASLKSQKTVRKKGMLSRANRSFKKILKRGSKDEKSGIVFGKNPC